jgi:hypothetical protein
MSASRRTRARSRRTKRHISQSEAHRLLATVNRLRQVLEDQRNAWIREWPDSAIHLVEIGVGESLDAADVATIATARKLRHAVVVTVTNGKLQLYAMELMAKKDQP